MLAVVVILALLALWLLAMRYGYDSRDGFRSEEEELARLGVSWEDLADPQFVPFLARERRQQLLAERRQPESPGGVPQDGVRARVARRLYALADRLDGPSTEAGAGAARA